MFLKAVDILGGERFGRMEEVQGRQSRRPPALPPPSLCSKTRLLMMLGNGIDRRRTTGQGLKGKRVKLEFRRKREHHHPLCWCAPSTYSITLMSFGGHLASLSSHQSFWRGRVQHISPDHASKHFQSKAKEVAQHERKPARSCVKILEGKE